MAGPADARPLGRPRRHQKPLPAAHQQRQPYSEAQFKTLKYRPDFPASFGSLVEARVFCQCFFTWYNTDHYHSGVGYHHPIDVHYGHAHTIQHARADVLADAYTRNRKRTGAVR